MPELRDIRWLFFDLGSTLINEEKAVDDRIRRMRQAFLELGKQVSVRAIRRAFEKASAEFGPSLVERAAQSLAGNPADVAYVLQRARYRNELEEPYPEAYGLLSRLAPQYKIGIIANQSPGAETRVEKHGLAPFISLFFSSAEVGLEKPDPAIFRLALSEAKCKPSRALMIGDRIDNDIRPANLLGLKTVRVLQGFGKAQSPRSPEEEPDFTVEGLGEIPDLLSRGRG